MNVVLVPVSLAALALGVAVWFPRTCERVAGWFQARFDEDEAVFKQIENEERA